MTIETLSYSERLKQRADLSAVIRLAESFLDLWADDAAEGSDEERAELAKARAEFDAVRPVIKAAPDLIAMLQQIARMKTDDEIQDESDGGQCMENDDAVSTVNSLIDQARGILSALQS